MKINDSFFNMTNVKPVIVFRVGRDNDSRFINTNYVLKHDALQVSRYKIPLSSSARTTTTT